MKFCALASGSSGNCYYIGTEHHGVLIDAGISAKAIEQALRQRELPIDTLCGIFITHEHMDHMKGVATLAKRYQIPVYTTKGTWQALADRVAPQLQNVLPSKGELLLGELQISWAPTYHDSAEGVFYTVRHAQNKIGILTDTGVVPDDGEALLKNSTILVLEANHNVRMLEKGPYPKFLQARILGKYGHLSNAYCGELLAKLIGNDTRHVVLAHLSETNNRPNVAYQEVKEILLKECRSGKVNLWVAGRTCGEVLEV